MSANPITAPLRLAAAQLLKQADEIDRQGITVGTDKPVWIRMPDGSAGTPEEAEAWAAREREELSKPHDFQPLAPGHVLDAGDNDKPDDDLLRAFGPFMDAAARADNPQVHDSTGARWNRITIKARAGTGPKSWATVRDETAKIWFSEWGANWRSDPMNAHLVPKMDVVDALFSKVYA